MSKRDLYEWSQQARSVWLIQGNSVWAAKQDGIPVRKYAYPHYHPPNSLSEDESPLVLPAVGQQITFSVELACRIGERGDNVSAADAQRLIASYHVFVAVRDNSYIQYARKCSNFPHFGKVEDVTKDYDYEVLHAWAAGFAQLSKANIDAGKGFPIDRAMGMTVDGFDSVDTNTNVYAHHPAAAIEMITQFVCVDEGDVISLGTAGPKIVVDPEQKLPQDTKLTARIDGVGEIVLTIDDRRSDDNYYSRSYEAGRVSGFV
jgi:2-keto-4-pentenoate hydratase/2-oxohepta-3-ene-1,7-dioic acid hydratase in catechol pathway